MPLNLLHQNSLYFVEDAALAKAYAAVQVPKQETRSPASDGLDKTMSSQIAARSGVDTVNLGEDRGNRLSSPHELRSDRNEEMLGILNATS